MNPLEEKNNGKRVLIDRNIEKYINTIGVPSDL